MNLGQVDNHSDQGIAGLRSNPQLGRQSSTMLELGQREEVGKRKLVPSKHQGQIDSGPID
jgi:hypothetical protein